MAEKVVRCVRCHYVFDAGEGPCPKCGTPYKPPAAPPELPDVPYAERYAGTPFAPPTETTPVAFRPRRNFPILMISGVTLVGVAMLIAIVAVFGGAGAGPTAGPIYVRPRTDPPSPPPTLPASVTLTIQQLNDPNLSADVTVQSVADVNDPSLGVHERHAVSFVGQIAAGNEDGIVIEEGITREYRVVGGVVFVRATPSARWSTAASIAGYLVIDPAFGLRKPQMLQLVGEETQDGQLVNHFQTTSSWAPDVTRISMIDTTGFTFKPDLVALNLWTSQDGSPLKAVFSATNTATNGTKLLDIETTYTFTNIGGPGKIEVPGPSPSGSLGASPSK
jgi:hypothetical protein